MTMRRGKILRAALCALALGANGAGALAQEKSKTQSQGEQQRTATIMVTPQIGEGAMQDRTFVFAGQGDAGFSFVSTEMMFDDKVVRGVPFSAEAVTESVQTLADGNRITHTSNSRVYRDSEGRTRREQSAGGVGAWATGEDAPQAIFLHDPVAGTGYILNPKTRTAQKLMQFYFNTRTADGATMQTFTKSENPKLVVTAPNTAARTPAEGGGISGKAIKKVQPSYPPIAQAAGAEGEVTVEVVVGEQGGVEYAKAISGHPLLQQAAVDAARQWTFSPTLLEGKPVKVKGRISFVFSKEQGRPGAEVEAAARERGVVERAAVERKVQERFPQTHESLGTQTVEGVQAEGTRNTITIPAGAVGNEREIKIVSERWYSPELQTVVMTKHSDPRFGETTYRLTNISRGEPDHSLFEVPAGYTVNDRGAFERKVMTREPQQEP